MNTNYEFRIVANDGKSYSLFRFTCSKSLFEIVSARQKLLLDFFEGYDPFLCSWVMALSELNISFTLKSISNEE